jgi:hypothetical protein
MPKSSIKFTPRGSMGMLVTLRTDKGWELSAEGSLSDAVPKLTGREALKSNRVVATNLWAYACQEKDRRKSRDQKQREALKKQAKLHADLACNVADLVDRLSNDGRQGYCSACFADTYHQKVEGGASLPTYLCSNCGAATVNCLAPKCPSMATRGFGPIRIPRYCAEHRHDIPGFGRGGERIDSLTDYKRLLEYEKPNLARTTKLGLSALAAVGLMTGVGLLAAPLVGGMIGTMVGGYSGAAATSYGLALLGGGSLATGGFGMVGGTAVIAAVGGGLGGILGMGVTNAYIREDKSFDIEKLKDGAGVPIVVCSGFLTEGKTGWGDWERPVTERYPNSPVYRVHWGAEDLKALSAVLGVGTGKFAGGHAFKNAVMMASKKGATKVNPLTGMLIAVDVVKNPWFRARQRANKTGAVVADLIARTDMDEVILVGHSLGARAMICAAEALGTKEEAPTVSEMHLLGAAMGAKGPWFKLSSAVEGVALNYHSRNDNVLRFFYSLAQGGQSAAGYDGMQTKSKHIRNVDVTREVDSHSDYCKVLDLQ